MLSFTNVGEFRHSKGNKKTRLGRRITDVSQRTQKTTPDTIALNRLSKLLDKSTLSYHTKEYYKNLLRNGEQLRFMNMAVLAEVIMFLEDRVSDINYRLLSPYVERLIPTRDTLAIEGSDTKEIYTEADLNIIRLRMTATFFRYIIYIYKLREQYDNRAKEMSAYASVSNKYSADSY